jgi:hypothetical protein
MSANIKSPAKLLGKRKSSTKTKTSKKTKNKKLTEDQLKQLADLVKTHPTIWDLSAPDHKKGDMVLDSWNQIADIIELSSK